MKPLITIFLAVLLALGSVNAYGLSPSDIKIAARQASVQPSFIIPVIKAYFTTPLEAELKQTPEELKEELEKLMDKRIAEAIKQATEDANESKHLTTLTTIESYGVQSKSRTEIALGAICPKWVEFPEKVLVVSKIAKKDISAWEKEYEKDVLAISETTGVSPSKATEMLKKLAAEGYQVTQTTVEPEAEVVLLHFSGWDDSYPSTLKWEVRVDGGPNLIRGYDPRGILIVQPIPEDENNDIKRVYVKAGYFDLKEQYKPKTPLEDQLAKDKENLEDQIKELEKELKKADKKEKEKRDITNATMYDVMVGYVTLESFYVKSAASGVYLGNMKVSKEMSGFSYASFHSISSEYKGVVLTNSHVAAMLYSNELYVSKDKEAMWIVLPAYGFIRYTQDSDSLGSPADLLAIDGTLVDSYDNDCAILVTSPIPGYEKYAARLGDSDKVTEGLEVVCVGSPMMIQKQLTEGIVSNTSYSILKSPLADAWLAEGMSRRSFEWAMASSFWVDTTQGAGGSSGSPVVALEGSQAGKVIALRNMGIVSRQAIATPMAIQKPDPTYLCDRLENGPIRLVLPKHWKVVFEGFDYKKAVFNASLEAFTGKTETMESIMQSGSKQDIAGLNGAVPINKIKQYLTERGLDIEKFGASTISGRYWQR